METEGNFMLLSRTYFDNKSKEEAYPSKQFAFSFLLKYLVKLKL